MIQGHTEDASPPKKVTNWGMLRGSLAVAPITLPTRLSSTRAMEMLTLISALRLAELKKSNAPTKRTDHQLLRRRLRERLSLLRDGT